MCCLLCGCHSPITLLCQHIELCLERRRVLVVACAQFKELRLGVISTALSCNQLLVCRLDTLQGFRFWGVGVGWFVGLLMCWFVDVLVCWRGVGLVWVCGLELQTSDHNTTYPPLVPHQSPHCCLPAALAPCRQASPPPALRFHLQSLVGGPPAL